MTGVFFSIVAEGSRLRASGFIRAGAMDRTSSETLYTRHRFGFVF